MARLTAKETRGIWAGVTLSWDEKYRFEEDTYARNIEALIAAGVHGIYTTGSTGEFYSLDYEEFCRMVDIVSGACGQAGMPLQIGCCTDATAKTIRLLEYAAGKKAVGAAQIAIPYWMEVTDRELLQFFKDLHTACPDMPIVHYNIPRAKRFLLGPDYQRILEVAPGLIGVKFTMAGSHFGALQDAIVLTPGVSYFVGENLLVSAMQIGARGCYSSMVCTDPAFMLEMYAKAAAGKWDEAIVMQKRISMFFCDLNALLEERGEGGIDPVVDKGTGIAAGFVLGTQRCRPPYIGWSDETVQACSDFMKAKYPELVFPG